MDDISSILEIERPKTPVINRETFITTSSERLLKKKKTKRPEGMCREVYALLVNGKNDDTAIIPTVTDKGYVKKKARLGMKKVRHWDWVPFVNSARTDGAVFKHWERVSDDRREYPFAKFNKKMQIPTYTDTEYNLHLVSENWSRAETDHLFDLAERFDLRFGVMQGRWEEKTHRVRSVEDLKDRYYSVIGQLERLRSGDNEKSVYVFDADHERRRKEQLEKIFKRTSEQIREEQILSMELKKIDARKKDRERKAQDLQKLISQAEGAGDLTKEAKKQPKKKTNAVARGAPRALPIDTVINTSDVQAIKFPKTKGSGVYLRSQRMKMPANLGQRKKAIVEQKAREFDIERIVPATFEIHQNLNEFYSEALMNHELKTILQTEKYELESLKRKFETFFSGQDINSF